MSRDTGPEASLRARTEAYRNVWDTHDAATVAAFYAGDADMVFGNLPAIRGRKAIQDWWQAYFERLEPERRLTLDVTTRLVAPKVGLVDVITTTGGKSRLGETLPARRFRATWIVGCRTGEWLIAALRGFPTQDDRVVLRASANPAQELTPGLPQAPAELRAFVDAYAGAFNRHDPETVSGFYTRDADIVVRNGPYTRGRASIEAWWRGYFAKPRPYRAMFLIDRVRTMAADVFVIDLLVTGVPRAAGPQTPPGGPPLSTLHNVRYTRATWVVVRESNAWRIAALRVLPSEDDEVIRSGGP